MPLLGVEHGKAPHDEAAHGPAKQWAAMHVCVTNHRTLTHLLQQLALLFYTTVYTGWRRYTHSSKVQQRMVCVGDGDHRQRARPITHTNTSDSTHDACCAFFGLRFRVKTKPTLKLATQLRYTLSASLATHTPCCVYTMCTCGRHKQACTYTISSKRWCGANL